VRTFDVVVGGAGLAGTISALRAQELGSKTLLLDAADSAGDGSNTVLSGGIVHAAMQDPRSQSDVLLPHILQAAGSGARPDVARAFADGCAAVLLWLQERGVRFDIDARRGSPQAVFAPPRSLAQLDGWRSVGGHAALTILRARLIAAGGTVVSGQRVTDIRWRSGSGVEGVLIVPEQVTIRTPSVVLADGGFHASDDLRKRFIGPAADRVVVRGSMLSLGDGLKMAESIGAKLYNTRFFYGHCLHRDALVNEELWPMPILDDLVEAGVVVAADGAQLFETGFGGIGVANELARLPDPTSAWVVVDHATWLASARPVGWPTAHPDLERRGAMVYCAPDIRRLAEVIGAVADRLQEAWSRLMLERVAGKIASRSSPREVGPFRAIPMVPGITFTMGGPLINGQAQVLDEQERPLAGLFAAGGSAGGLQGADVTGGYVGGLAPAAVFGFIAGTGAAMRSRCIP
jgi:fumarate reductase flavoprotein subunit